MWKNRLRGCSRRVPEEPGTELLSERVWRIVKMLLFESGKHDNMKVKAAAQPAGRCEGDPARTELLRGRKQSAIA